MRASEGGPTAVPRIDQARAKSLLDEGAATFVDVRSREDYRQLHIPGALSIPLAELSARLGEVPRGKPVITY